MPAPVVGRLARLYLSTGQPDKAVRLLAPLVDAQATNVAMHSLLVQAYEEAEQQANALDAVEKGLQRFQGDPNLLAQYWRLLSGLQGREAAIQACYKAQSDWPRSVQVQIKALQFLSRMGDEDGCKTAFEGIEYAEPDHQQGVLARVYHLMSQKDAAGARAILERLRGRTGRTRLIDLKLSDVYFWLGLLDDAIELLTRLTADHANDVEAAMKLADYRRHVGDFDGARAALDSTRIDRIGPRIQRLCILAEIALDTAEIEAALSLMSEAVKLAPDHIYPWQLKARAELMAGDVQASWKSHRNWVKLRWTKDESGRVTNKVGHSLHGQVLNEFRLLGDEPALMLSRPGQDQRLAARGFKECLREVPLSTPLALSLMTSLRRCGAISGTPERLATQLPHEDRIPRTLFQFWDTPEPPHQVTALMEENRLANPGYSYRRFDVLTAQQFLREKEETEALKAFRLAPHAAAKADIFRLVLLWHEGGVFLDADDRCTAPLDGLIDHRMRFVGYQEPPMSIGNNFLAVQPHEPIIRAALEDAVTAFNGPRGESIWLATGPGAITRAVATAGTDEAGMLLPGVHILPMYTMRRAISPHIHLSYKSTASAWQEEFRRPVNTPIKRSLIKKETA
jgi:tetratricopeptide (TPR) repeat protein